MIVLIYSIYFIFVHCYCNFYLRFYTNGGIIMNVINMYVIFFIKLFIFNLFPFYKNKNVENQFGSCIKVLLLCCFQRFSKYSCNIIISSKQILCTIPYQSDFFLNIFSSMYQYSF